MVNFDSDAVLVERVRKALDGAIEARSEFVSTGKCATIEDYRYQCGIAVGLRAARKCLDDEYKKVNNDE